MDSKRIACLYKYYRIASLDIRYDARGGSLTEGEKKPWGYYLGKNNL